MPFGTRPERQVIQLVRRLRRLLTLVCLTLFALNSQLRQYLDAHNYPYEYYENDGGHIWRNWRIYLTLCAQKIFKD